MKFEKLIIGFFKKFYDGSSKYFEKNVIAICLLGFVAAIPFPLVFGTLSLWYKEEGISYTAIGFLSMAKFPYALRFLWAPIIDGLKLPKIGKIGHRKSWLYMVQMGLMFSILFMASTKPSINPYMTGYGALMLDFFSASQDIIIDALRIEILPDSKQGQGAGAYVFGYRLGLIISGAGAILLSVNLGWNITYIIMALFILIGIITNLVLKEKKKEVGEIDKNFIENSVINPIKDFVTRKGWYVIVIFLLLYKLNNATIATFANPFYKDIGFSKEQIAYVVKIYGLFATLIGGFLGGVIVSKVKMIPCLLWTGIVEAFTSIAFAYLAYVCVTSPNVEVLMAVVSFDNLVGSIGNVVLIAYLSSLCNRSYTATQYALLSSLIAVSRDFLAAFTGIVLDNIGYIDFFVFNAFLVVPSLLLIRYLPKVEKK